MPRVWTGAAGLGLAVLAACAAPALDPADRADGADQAERAAPEYLGIETRLLDDDLVTILVTMRGVADRDDLDEYARCAAARYTLIRGYGFARHVRTRTAQDGSLWRADAVYTISASLPRGAQTVDAEVTVADCTERGIPTI
ncbi:MAG: hypothetical protein AAFU80_04330 [Pseudomonadota bacterium]